MVFVRLLRMLCGSVAFRAEGGFCERFINLCSLRRIPLWNLKTENGKIFACTTLEGYLRIHESAVKSGMRLYHTKAIGLPFFIKKYHRRSGVLFGFGIFFAVIGMLSSMVWTIDINSNSKVTDGEILSVLEEAGLKPGIFKDSINAPEIRFYALSRLPDVTYLTVNLIGSCVRVDVTERIEEPDIPDDDTPCDIVSAVDGQLAVLEIYEGTKLHSVGEAIGKGETIVGGFIELADGSVRFRHAAAYAVINTQLSIKSEPEKPQKTLHTEKTEYHNELHIFGLDIPLFIKSNKKPDFVRSSYLYANGRQLPIGFTRSVYKTYTEKSIERSTKKENLSTAEKYFEQKVQLLASAELINESITVNETICAEFNAAISAGITSRMLIEE